MVDNRPRAEVAAASISCRLSVVPAPGHEAHAPQEFAPFTSLPVRAFADVDAGDNLNVRVGPELILKDEQRERAGANKQPESALGMGMQFKLGF